MTQRNLYNITVGECRFIRFHSLVIRIHLMNHFYISLGINSVRYGTQNIHARSNSMFAVTTKGEVCTFNANTHSNSTESSDQEFISSNDMQENEYTQEIPVMNNDAGGNIKSTTFIHPLENSFGPGSALFVTAKICENADR